VPLFDPTLPPTSGRNYVTVSKVAVFFIDEISGNSVIGRFMSITTSGDPCAFGGPGVGQAFIRGITLIQ
jgi:hypothetical protein